MLEEEAEYWWKATETILSAQHIKITWEVFMEAFKEQFIPETAQRMRQEEFRRLTQGNQTVEQYEAKFLALSRYDEEIQHDEKKKVKRFLEGLKPMISRNLIPLEMATYIEAVQRAQWMEKDYELH